MSEELLPCSFCGGEGFMYNVVPNYAWWACRCASCGVETSSYHTEAEAIEAWNRRVDDHFRDATKMIERTAKVETYTDDQQETWMREEGNQ